MREGKRGTPMKLKGHQGAHWRARFLLAVPQEDKATCPWSAVCPLGQVYWNQSLGWPRLLEVGFLVIIREKRRGKVLVSALPWQEAHFSFFFSLIQNTYYISETIGAEFTLVNRTLRELIMQRRSQTINKQSNRLEKRWTIRDVGRARRMIGAPL